MSITTTGVSPIALAARHLRAQLNGLRLEDSKCSGETHSGLKYSVEPTQDGRLSVSVPFVENLDDTLGYERNGLYMGFPVYVYARGSETSGL